MRDVQSRAITLVEVLVALAIVLVLAGLLLPVLSRARSSAEGARTISNMQQLGHAFTLYTENWNEFPPNANALQNEAKLPLGIYRVEGDNRSMGFANWSCATWNPVQRDCTGFPRTLAMFSDLGLKVWGMKEFVMPQPNVGWLIDPSALSVKTFRAYDWKGSYRRLLLDGSVLTRYIEPYDVETSRGTTMTVSDYRFFFSDPPQEVKDEWVKIIL